MAQKDYYAVLGVAKTATQDEIKSAYRTLAKKYHPDLHPGDTQAAEKMKEVNEAYSVLGDADKRAKYDRGEMDMGQGFGGFRAEDIDLSDLFSMFGMGNRASRRSPNGESLRYKLNLTFMEACLGCSKEITFNRLERCTACGGTGAKNASSMTTCDKCHGTGQVQYRRQTLFGTQVTTATCDKCGGSGKIITEKCPVCNGKGLVSKKKIITVNIPAGVDSGDTRTLEGQGNAAPRPDAANGNLILVIEVAKSKVFRQRDGLDLYVNVPVPYSVAVTGGEIDIPTIYGVIKAKLPEGTANGEIIRFKGKGIKTARATGDLYITVNIEVPRSLSKNQKEIIENFEKELTLKNYPRRKEYLENISEMYKK